MSPPKTKNEIVKIGNNSLTRSTFDVGWKWSVDIKPLAGTESCQVHHLICIISGQLEIAMDDGTKIEAGPGDIVDVLPGHDAWVVGDEPVVGIDIGINNAG